MKEIAESQDTDIQKYILGRIPDKWFYECEL